MSNPISQKLASKVGYELN